MVPMAHAVGVPVLPLSPSTRMQSLSWAQLAASTRANDRHVYVCAWFTARALASSSTAHSHGVLCRLGTCKRMIKFRAFERHHDPKKGCVQFHTRTPCLFCPYCHDWRLYYARRASPSAECTRAAPVPRRTRSGLLRRAQPESDLLALV